MFCPYMDRFKKDCNKVLTFRNLSYALHLCTSDYHRCPIYAKLQEQQRAASHRFIAPRPVA